ncbi:MAG: DNA-directed RNA polymerase subunit beta' [Alphaproteobacteria bacterium]|nr:DNA-directed RNA polymerase subunit beta' [Alphaproteobacteria bacterium]
MNEMQKLFGKVQVSNDFDRIKISLASPEKIRAWSFGEVKKPETINYRTFKPEKDGLFCARIFGPNRDYECLCGKYKRMKYKGVVCEKCQVEVTLAKVRRERMGHVELAAPVAHIWFLKSLPSRIGLMADMMLKDLESVLYFEKYIVIEAGLTSLQQHELLTEEQYVKAIEEFGEDAFRVGIGAEALREILQKTDLKAEVVKMREELLTVGADAKRKKLVKRLKLYEAFLESNTRPEWMILEVLPVLPPDLRPLVPLEGGRFATSDLNDLYRRVINRNNRLKRLMELRAPSIIIRNEKRMLQEAVDALFDNGRGHRAITGISKRPLKSIADMLKGKQGRFRQNLLGKRVDYSGRSVIIAGPELKLHQCGLPKKMALELFKPFIYAKLETYGHATTIKAAKRMVEKERPEVWDILEEVIKEHPVLLNRAPTLHRLSIQAFEPVLIEGKAIQLHPLVCVAFNADFDGDQMAVHVPLSLEAQLEARVLMMSTNNICKPADGVPVHLPTQDMVLGIYYLTMEGKGEKGEGMIFADIAEIQQALDAGVVTLHARITARYETLDENGNTVYKRVETTPGRMLLSEILPKQANVDFSLININFDKKRINDLVASIYKLCSHKTMIIFVDRLMRIGFKHAALAGISIGRNDIVVPQSKDKLVSDTKAKVQEFEKQYQNGLITQQEKAEKVIDIWDACTNKVFSDMAELLATPIPGIDIGRGKNSLDIIVQSGARGNAGQMKQLGAMRGTIAKNTGEIMETPVISNYKEGLTMAEYFNSSHGARKGTADTALRTAQSGYLTRKLVDVAQDAIINTEDCGTENGITMHAVFKGGTVEATLAFRIQGRICQEDVKHPETGKVVVKRGKLLDSADVVAIDKAGVDGVYVRSPLTCDNKTGLCAKCYGLDLSRHSLVNMGEAVGVIAAQSIGEPGTQLTMRTFHLGGVSQKVAEQSSVEADFDTTIKLLNFKNVVDKTGAMVVISRNCEVALLDNSGREKARHRLPYGTSLFFKDGQAVAKGKKIAGWNPFIVPAVSEKDGIIKFIDMVDGDTMREIIDESTGLSSFMVIDWKQSARTSGLKPQMLLVNEKGDIVKLPNGQEARYPLSVNAVIVGRDGDKVSVGDVLYRLPRESSKSQDITVGLPRVTELFEARRPKDPGIIAGIDGVIEFAKDYKTRRRIFIVNRDTDESREYILPRGKSLLVADGDSVRRGDVLVDGIIAPHDILQALGVEALADYLINEIQSVYRMQGQKINDKHMEVIVRQMLQKVEVIDPGDTTLLAGEQLTRDEVQAENVKVPESGRKAAVLPVLLGITKASLQTESFISAASFQETTRVLTESAVLGREDKLAGLKENVIVGRLIPAGTGASINRLRALAEQLDKEESAVPVQPAAAEEAAAAG